MINNIKDILHKIYMQQLLAALLQRHRAGPDGQALYFAGHDGQALYFAGPDGQGPVFLYREGQKCFIQENTNQV